MKTIQKITLALVIIFTSLSYAQNSTQNWEDLEGTWKYQDGEVEFYINLKYKQVEVYKGDIMYFLVGYAKLSHQNELIYDNLHKLKNVNKEVLNLKEINGIEDIDNNVNIKIRNINDSLVGTFLIANYGGLVNVKCEYDNELLTLHFSKPRLKLIGPDAEQKKEAMYANHIPELPSTWLLERVTEEEIKE